jgi:transposase
MALTRPDAGTRIQVLTLLQKKTPIAQIIAETGYKERNIYRILKTAKERGYDPDKSKTLYLCYAEGAPRSGRPKKITPEVEEQVIKAISKNSTTRELFTQKIADIVSPLVRGGLSDRSVHRILRRCGYKPCKPTKKPGLTKENKLAQLTWCLDHKDWTLEDWKNVIWSDETSITWGGQRGRIRVWRTVGEVYQYYCIRRRWKGFKQFMFWACFSYNMKGPCHVWEDETTKEKKEAKEWMEKINCNVQVLQVLAWVNC